MVTNIVGKGENAGYQHFPTMFSKGFFMRVVKLGLCGKELKAFENIMGRGEDAGNQQFLLYRNVFYHTKKSNSEFSPGLYGVAPCYALKKFDTWHYALKSPIRFNLISDTAWC